MRGNFKEQLLSAVNAVTQATVTGAKAASKFVQQETLGAQCLLDYCVGPQVASAGSGQALWRIFSCRSKKEGSPHPVVSAWIMDKRELTQTEEQLYGGHGGGGGLTRPSQHRLDAFIEQCRHDVHALARLKHPCVLRLIAPLEESRTQLVFITEPVFASLGDLLGGSGGSTGPAALPAALAQERRSLRLSELEIKHGLLQLADGLHFLHSEAGLVHRGLCPSSVIITAVGAWKLAGFAFSASLQYRADQHKAYDYSDPDPSILQLVTQPPLPYVAPELVDNGVTGITGAADVFSLGALTFELLTRRQLLPVGSCLADYESRLHSLTLVDMSGVPMGLEQPLRSMVAPVAAARPPAAAFAGGQYFQGDVLLRALKFLDTMLQREPLQKASFLRDLPAMCAQFDSRVLRYLVLPPLLQELRDVTLQPTLLPIVLTIMQQQDPAEFVDATLPALKPVLSNASGETLLLLVQNAELLCKCMPPVVAAQVLPALLVRAAEHGDVRAQEEMLKRVAAMAAALDYEALKKSVLPAVHALCLGTTSASVRVSAFAAMSRLVQRLDAAEAEAMLQTAVKVTAVDKSAPTVMCVLALGAALGKQHGARLSAERVLPTLVPLLVAPTLNSAQFGTALKTVRDVLAQIEKSRGGGCNGAVPGGGFPLAAGSTPGIFAPGGGAGMGGKLGAPATAAAAPVDWMTATAVGPSVSPTSRLVAAATAANGNGNDPLEGLQLRPAVGAASARPTAPGPDGNSGFGPGASRAGSGMPPMGSLAASSSAAAAELNNWAFGGSGGIGRSSSPGMMRPAQQQQYGGSRMGGSGTAGGASPRPGIGTSSTAASLSDPFAGLQLGGASSSSSRSVRWPAAQATTALSGATAFDPFALGSNVPGSANTPAGFGGSALQRPAPPPAAQQGQQRQEQQRPGSGTGWPAGGSLI